MIKMKEQIKGKIAITLLGCILLGVAFQTQAQRPRRDLGPSTLNVEKGVSAYSTSNLKLELLNASQTVASLKANDESTLDYTPGDRLKERDKNRFYHLGDINLGLRAVGDTSWAYYSTASNRADVEALAVQQTNVLSAANLAKTLPAEIPLQVIRYWEKDGENLVLRFELTNKTQKSVEIGALGIPLVFNNNFNGKSLDQAHAENVFFDPSIGKDAGYLQIVKLNGEGKVLLVVPYGKTPFENYRPLLDDPTPIGYTFEGLHEWMVHSKSYAETEWKGVEQWNTPTSSVLKPGETKSYGVKLLVTNSLREVEKTLSSNGHPVAVGIPGYVIPMDVNAKLFLQYNKAVKKITVQPEGAIEIKASKEVNQLWKTYEVKGKKWGRARVTIDYEDGLSQTISYKIIEPEKEVIASYGKFLTTEQWYDDTTDVFGRAPSAITYDYEKKEKVLQDSRVWIAGLSDEGGAGSWLGAIMKQVVMPEKEEVAKLEDFVNQTIWGGIQYNEGEQKYGVRKSMYYYEPDSMPKGTYSNDIRWGKYDGFPSWSKRASESVGRSYNYPHVAAAHWAMYRLARYHKGVVDQQNWRWYLENAAQTAIAMLDQAPDYVMHGQMEGTIFILILNDLKAEGLNELADQLRLGMKVRFYHWNTLSYPFGSERPWDSTGQEEVYMWSKYFGFDEGAMVTLNAILAYMPTVPHWAYNGNARRIWDFLYGGKLSRFERMIHHYGSALNSIPVLYQYRENPSDLYLLRVGYGGLLGAISNITEDGFAPCAFHSFPQTLANDGITGDYGTGFFGYAVNTSAYLVKHEELGWLSFGGNTSVNGDWVKTELTTAARNRFYVAPVGLWLTLDAGEFKSVAYNVKSREVTIEFEKSNEFTPEAYLHVETLSKEPSAKHYDTASLTKSPLGSFSITLNSKPVTVTLNQKNK
jgi:hypothetical protein